MNNERLGIVPLTIDGRTVPIRFTWAVIDRLGRQGVAELLEKAGSGEPGDMSALADLIEAASGGQMKAVDLMAGAVPFNDAFVPIIRAWSLAVRRPANATANPLMRLLIPTWLKRLTAWLAARAFRMKNFGDQPRT